MIFLFDLINIKEFDETIAASIDYRVFEHLIQNKWISIAYDSY